MVDYEKKMTKAEFSRFYSLEYFQRFSEESGYPVSWFIHPPRKWSVRAETLLALADLHGTENVLEAGSALGSLTGLIAPNAASVTGVDLSRYAVEESRKRAKRKGISNVRFEVGSIDDLSQFPDASFDRVLAFDIVEHVYDPVLRGFFQESYRVLRRSGTLCIFTPNLDHYVERIKQHNFVIKQTPEHIAVRNWPMLKSQLRESGANFAEDTLFFNTAPYPVIRHVERLLKTVPLVKKFVQWRLCVRLAKR